VKGDKAFLLFPGIILLGFVLRAYGLSSQGLSGDDRAVAVSAVNYMESGNLGPTMWNHPNLRNILVYLSMMIFGGGIWGLKIVSLALGTLSVLLMGLTTDRIFRNKEAALMAAFFLAIDPLHIDYSRQAVHEIHMMSFALAGILFAFKFRDDRKPVLLILSGVFFGLGIASKWYVAFPLAVTYIFLVYGILKDSRTGNNSKLSMGFFISSALIILPFIVYLLTFIPWFGRGYGISEWFSLQNTMYIETKTHTGYNPYGFELDTKAYLWFIRPVAYADFVFSEGSPRVLLGFSNPLVWLLTLPATIYIFYLWRKEKKAEYFFVFCLFWITYLPFLMTSRPIWAHTAFSVLPFSFMAVSYSILKMFSGKNYRRTVIAIYLALVISLSIPLYLLSTGKGLEINYLRPIVELYRPLHER